MNNTLGKALQVAAQETGVPIPEGKNVKIPEWPELELPVDHRKMVVVKLNFTVDRDDKGAPYWVPEDVIWEDTRDLLSEDQGVKGAVPQEKSWKTGEGRLRQGRIDTADKVMSKCDRFVSLRNLWDDLDAAGYVVFGAKAYWKKNTGTERPPRRGEQLLQKGSLEITFVYHSRYDEFYAISKAAGVIGIGVIPDSQFAGELKKAMSRDFGFCPCFSNSVPSECITINPQNKADHNVGVKRVNLTLKVRDDQKLAFRFDLQRED